jgi:hypothetical protein
MSEFILVAVASFTRREKVALSRRRISTIPITAPVSQALGDFGDDLADFTSASP